MNPVSARLLSQQLVCPQFSDPAEVVSWFGAVQAQDARSMQWAVTMRTRHPSFSAFKKAFDEGRILRAHLLRCTWQLVSAEDFQWIRQLIYRKSLGVMNGWTTAMGFKFSAQEQDRTLGIIEDLLREKGVVTEDEINAALLEGGIPGEHLLYSHHLRMAELEGLVCSGPLGPKSTYMLTSERIPNCARPDPDEALSMFTFKYFRSHGPATVEDFAWWSALSKGECRKGIKLCGDSLTEIRDKGRIFYVDSSARTRGFRSGTLHLLPPYDEYLIGYKSRDVVLPPEHRHHAHDQKGIFRPVVALDGEIVGNWRPSSKDGGVTLFKEGISLPEGAAERSFSNFQAAKTR